MSSAILHRPTVASGPACPDCVRPLIPGSGCFLCPSCGYSPCG